MFKITCILALALASVICVPVESPTDSKGLNRPSPINPDVISDPKPKDVSTSAPEIPPPISSDTRSHIQKIPAKGEKLSSELDQHKQTQRRETTSQKVSSKTGARRNQSTSTSTAAPEPSTTTTHEPVSLKTPIAPSSNTKVKRDVESSEATTNGSTTTHAPIASSSNDDNDNSAPHFVRPVPVEQILKKIHDAPKHHEPSQVVSLHDHETPSTPITTTTDSNETKKVENHKVHRVSVHKKKDSDDDKSSEEDKSSDQDKPSDEDKKYQ